MICPGNYGYCRVRPLRTLAILLAFTGVLPVLVFVTTPSRAYACSCAPLEHPTESLAKSDSVFAGRVVSITESESDNTDYPVLVEFDVSLVWKGPDCQTTVLRTSLGASTCGYRFVSGLEYLVYSPDGSRVSSCSRTRLLVGASNNLAELGARRSPVSGSARPTSGPSRNRTGGGCELGSPSADVAVVGLMVGLVWFGLRRRRAGDG